MFKNALVSVSDKTGLEDFLAPYVEKGMRIVSSGGTARYLQDKGFDVVKVSEQTGFPEVMDGRVKTLHPHIHMPLLCRQDNSEDMALLREKNLSAFDLVVVNLYPFAQALEGGKQHDELIEFIDIGGPTLLRAAAKSLKHIVTLCDPSDYARVQGMGEISLAERQQLAAKVFLHVSQYDQHIANYLHPTNLDLHIGGQFHQELRYGENPQQQASWFRSQEWGLHQAQILQGKELSYNNILDISAAVDCLQLFEKPTAVAVKHNNPCGVASADSISLALEKALKADPVSVFGGILALNAPIGVQEAKAITPLFLECVVAPAIDQEAQDLLAKKKNLRVLQWASMQDKVSSVEIRTVAGGFLKQSQDQVLGRNPEWRLVSGDLSEADWSALEFSWKLVSALKSNAIAVSNGQQSLGMGMGQVNRVDAVRQALQRAHEFHANEKDLYLASDAFFPFADSIEMACQGGVKAIIQPGGSMRDEEVIAKAQELGVTMVFTGQRHFRH